MAVVNKKPANLFATFCKNVERTSMGVVRDLPRLKKRLSTLCPRGCVCSITNFPGIHTRRLVSGLGRRVTGFRPAMSLRRSIRGLRGRTSKAFGLAAGGRIRCSGAVVVATNGNTFRPHHLRLRDTTRCRNAGLRCFVSSLDRFTNGGTIMFKNKSSTMS